MRRHPVSRDRRLSPQAPNGGLKIAPCPTCLVVEADVVSIRPVEYPLRKLRANMERCTRLLRRIETRALYELEHVLCNSSRPMLGERPQRGWHTRPPEKCSDLNTSYRSVSLLNR